MGYKPGAVGLSDIVLWIGTDHRYLSDLRVSLWQGKKISGRSEYPCRAMRSLPVIRPFESPRKPMRQQLDTGWIKSNLGRESQTRPQIRDLIAASRPLKLGTYIGTPKTMQILLGIRRYTKTPRPIFYHIGTPKSIGILLGLCLIILVSYNGLGRTIFPLMREEQIMFKAPPSPLPPPLLT